MPVLREITKVSPDAAAALEKAGFVSDTDIKSLTRQDLEELIPGPQEFRLRKTIGDIIQNVKPINAVLKELLDSIPGDYVKAVLTKNCVLDDYLVILRDMKTKVESVNSFLEAYIGLFEEYNEKQQKPPMTAVIGSVGSPVAVSPVAVSRSVAAQSTLRVQVIGKTKNCRTLSSTLLKRVRQLDGLHVDETNSDPKVIIVFCPVKTHHKTEIKAAMKDVAPGGAAVILVVMHNTLDVSHQNIVRSLDNDCGCRDFVNVLYHKTVPDGLLTCEFNELAVAQLRCALLKHSSVVRPVAATAAAAQCVLC